MTWQIILVITYFHVVKFQHYAHHTLHFLFTEVQICRLVITRAVKSGPAAGPVLAGSLRKQKFYKRLRYFNRAVSVVF